MKELNSQAPMVISMAATLSVARSQEVGKKIIEYTEV